MAKRQTKVLNDMQLRRWVQAGAPLAKSDGAGLMFTLSTAGTAAWVLPYRIAGKREELTLGRYPDLLLAAARRLAAEKWVDVSKRQQSSDREA